jgi:hypothetical protein
MRLHSFPSHLQVVKALVVVSVEATAVVAMEEALEVAATVEDLEARDVEGKALEARVIEEDTVPDRDSEDTAEVVDLEALEEVDLKANI